MQAKSWMWGAVAVLGMLTSSGCKLADSSSYWCRHDNRACFATQSECTHPLNARPHVACFQQPKVYCFALIGGWLERPGGRALCVPTVDECVILREDHLQSATGLAIGSCVQATNNKRTQT